MDTIKCTVTSFLLIIFVSVCNSNFPLLGWSVQVVYIILIFGILFMYCLCLTSAHEKTLSQGRQLLIWFILFNTGNDYSFLQSGPNNVSS